MADNTATTGAPIDDKNVSVFNQVTDGGIVYIAPKGTAVPQAFTKPSALDPAFKSLGDIGEDGFTESTDSDSDDYKNINGNTVLSVSKGKTRKFEFHFIEAERVELMKFVYGNAMTGTDGKLSKVDLQNAENPECVMVIYEMLSSGTLRMTVLDRAKPTDFGDLEHSKGNLMDYDVTVTALDNGGKSGTMYYGTAA